MLVTSSTAPSLTTPVAVNFFLPKYSPKPQPAGTLPLPFTMVTVQG
jgi:hypothetical protein